MQGSILKLDIFLSQISNYLDSLHTSNKYIYISVFRLYSKRNMKLILFQKAQIFFIKYNEACNLLQKAIDESSSAESEGAINELSHAPLILKPIAVENNEIEDEQPTEKRRYDNAVKRFVQCLFSSFHVILILYFGVLVLTKKTHLAMSLVIVTVFLQKNLKISQVLYHRTTYLHILRQYHQYQIQLQQLLLIHQRVQLLLIICYQRRYLEKWSI